MMGESWSSPDQPAALWTAEKVLLKAEDIGDGWRLAEITLHTDRTTAWNPTTTKRLIHGPGVIQYLIHGSGVTSRLHPIGRCLGTVKSPNNDDKQCDVSGLPVGATRCADHHAPGTVGA